jgi:diguanylate cyclase (GGDEF)-like protein
MNNYTSPSSQAVDKTQKKLLKNLKHQIESLSQFVIRLSGFYEGVNPKLDKDLEPLRGHLGGKVNFALAESSMLKINKQLMDNTDSVKQQSKDAIKSLEVKLKKLQTWENIPDDLHSQVIKLLASLQLASDDLFGSVPYFGQAFDLYQKALNSTDKKPGATVAVPPTKVSKSTSEDDANADKLHEEISQELRDLISHLRASGEKNTEIDAIYQRLVKGLSRTELLECCLIIIKALLQDVVKERRQAEKFIGNVHKTLVKANESVDKSLEQAQSQFQLKTEANSQLKDHISEIGVAVDEASDLSLLKEKTNNYLRKMSETLETREEADAQEQKYVMQLLEEMRTQLSQLESETAKYKSRLAEQRLSSQKDALTQLPNRLAYNNKMDVEYRRWQRHATPLSMALVDVDFFKKINDTYGHAAGDKTLQVIARHISKYVRSTDFVSRWGGEEFVILLPHTTAEDLAAPLEQIRKKIEEIPFKFKQQQVTITVSIGASSFSQGDTIDSVFERVDSALYKAKNEGRNRCIIA